MSALPSVVITGIGVACPLGIGREAVEQSLAARRAGFRRLDDLSTTGLRGKVAGIVPDFDPALYVRPRKSLKVMARDSQLTLAAADLVRTDARLSADSVDPDRIGVIFGADVIRNPLNEVAEPFRGCFEEGEYDFARWGEGGMRVVFPLSMLKLLPNMPACHVSISQDARGPNNTVCLREASGLAALGEARRVVERGWADVMLAGGASSRLNAYDLARFELGEEVSACDDPDAACRPFDSGRDGQVLGEAAAILTLERADFAARRGATVLAEIRGWGSAGEPVAVGASITGRSVRAAVEAALADARLKPGDVGFVSAHGIATRAGDAAEAQALNAVLPGRPVFAPKSYFGNLGGACGIVETAIAALALARGSLPPTLHCERPDPACPVNLVRDAPLTSFAPVCVVVNYTGAGQAVAVVLSAPK
jgi:3-oxoacyl-[acyl-carrier-protein] synthase II